MAIIVTRIERLHCDQGHEWERAPRSGRKPTTCPEHTPEAPERIAHCDLGDHDWKPTARGRTPRNCPEHTPALVRIPRGQAVRLSVHDIQDLIDALDGVVNADKLARAKSRAATIRDEMLKPLIADHDRSPDTDVTDAGTQPNLTLVPELVS